MLTNEVVLNVFADHLSRDPEYEVVSTRRGYTVLGWDKRGEEWDSAELCPTPEERSAIDAECKALSEKCRNMGIEMLT